MDQILDRLRVQFPSVLVSLIIEKGTTYPGALLRKDVRRGRMKECFSNALDLAQRKGWTYVEGLAISGKLLKLNIPMEHAWCIDDKGQVVDNTWEDSTNSLYRGIPMDADTAMEFCVAKGTYGVFLNEYGVYNMPAILKFAPEFENRDWKKIQNDFFRMNDATV